MRKLFLIGALFVMALLAPVTADAAGLSSSDWSNANIIRTHCGNDMECAADVIREARSEAVFSALTGACGQLPPDGKIAGDGTLACWNRGLDAVKANQ